MDVNNRRFALLLFIVFALLAGGCRPAPQIEASVNPGSIRFSGERAMAIERDFVTRFPNRHSGQPNNRLAAEWVRGQLTSLGWNCRMQEWQIVNYNRPVPLNNTVCDLPGESPREILVVAHHDQAPTTVQGADNDGSGIAILLHLAEIFTAEAPLPHSLTFVSTDAEEYGMIGSRYFIQNHPDPSQIIAGISLDNLGRYYYDGMNMELIGQFRGYAPIWLPLAVREAARAAGLWQVHLRSPLDQIIDQAGPISFMDQGPMVAAGVPAVGLAAHVPPEYADEHYHRWHHPDDDLESQSPAALASSGATAEALIRQLLSMETFPQDSGPYIYLDSSQQVLRGFPLWSIFIGFVSLFFLGSAVVGESSLRDKLSKWRLAIPHFLGLWLPLLGSILLLYLFVEVGLMDEYHLYPATSKDPALLNPRWPAVVLFLIGLSLFLYLGRMLVSRFTPNLPAPPYAVVKSAALLIIGLSLIYILVANPFSLLFCLPLLFWFLIRGRGGLGRALDIIFFLLGGLAVYALIYQFGFVVLRYDFAMLWFLMNMFSIRMIGFPTAVVITAIIGAGLMLLVSPPYKRVQPD